MKESGKVLLTGAEKEGLGILVFDVTSAPAAFVAENSDLVAKFLTITADSNAMWADTTKQAEMLPVIAKDAGLDEAATAETMATFVFPTIAEQLSAKWLGGGALRFMGGVAGVFKTAGNIPAGLETYDATVNAGPLIAEGAMLHPWAGGPICAGRPTFICGRGHDRTDHRHFGYPV